jgi:hypothetical protein
MSCMGIEGVCVRVGAERASGVHMQADIKDTCVGLEGTCVGVEGAGRIDAACASSVGEVWFETDPNSV